MNFQSPQMLIIFGSIFAVSMISLVVLLLIRSKKMKTAGALPDNQTAATMIQQPTSIGMTTATSVATPSPTISQPDPIANSMQLTSNPFEVNAIDLNSQNLGGNLEAKGGMPNEGIMQNPNTAPNMEIASPVLSAEPMNPHVNTPAPVNDIPAMNPSLDFGSAASATPVTAQTVTPNTIPTIEPAVTAVQPEPQIPVANANPIITPAMPTPVETAININAINSSGLDTSAQPTNPMTAATPQDPAGIFSQPPQAQVEPIQAAVPQAIAAEDMEIKISDLPKVSEPENVTGIPTVTPITANTVADLTPTTNISQPTTQPITPPVATTEIKLPDIAEINTVSSVPEPQIPQEAVIEMQMPAAANNIQTNTVNAAPQNTIPTTPPDAGLPPLPNMVNTQQPIVTTSATVNPAPTNPVIAQTPTMPTQPLATTIPSPMPVTQQPIATSINGLPPLK